MKGVLFRWLGFSVPTIGLVTALHLQGGGGTAAALDGALSGSWFALIFGAGALPARLLDPGARRPMGVEFGLGLVAGVVTWVAVWGLWRLPNARALQGAAFAINSTVMFVAAFAIPLVTRGRKLLAT